MFHFFKKTSALITANSRFASPQRQFSVVSKKFELAGKPSRNGIALKVQLSTSSIKAEDFLMNSVIKSNPDSLFVVTMPTTRSIDGTIYPGHNCSLVTDEKGKISCSMSKRPNISKVLYERNRVPDGRFSAQPPKMRAFHPSFTTVEEDISRWVQRALLVPDYPLYIHIIPLEHGLAVDSKSYKDNVEHLKELSAPFILHGSVHSDYDLFIQANNCNTATEQAIFGPYTIPSVNDMFCQQAAINMTLRFVNNESHYLRDVVEALELMKGVEASTISEYRYLSPFTC